MISCFCVCILSKIWLRIFIASQQEKLQLVFLAVLLIMAIVKLKLFLWFWTVRWTKNGWHFYNNIYGFDHFNRTIFDSVFDLTWFFEVRNIFSKTNEVDKEMIVKMLLSLMKLTIRTKKIHIWNLPRKFIFCVITAMTPECFILKWKGLVLLRFVYG